MTLHDVLRKLIDVATLTIDEAQKLHDAVTEHEAATATPAAPEPESEPETPHTGGITPDGSVSTF